MSNTRKRRVAVYLNPRSLALVGSDQSAKGVCRAIDEYAEMLEAAGASLAAKLSDADWAFALEVFDLSIGAIAQGYRATDHSFCDALAAALNRTDMADAVREAGGRDAVNRLIDRVRKMSTLETKALILALRAGLRMMLSEAAPVRWWTPWARIAWAEGLDLDGQND